MLAIRSRSFLADRKKAKLREVRSELKAISLVSGVGGFTSAFHHSPRARDNFCKVKE